MFFWWIKIIKIDFGRKILNIFFWICEKKVVYKKIWKKYRFWKKIGVWEWILGRLVGSGGQKWGFGPPKRGQNGIFCSALGFLRCPGPPLGGPKTGYRGQKLIGWVKKWSKMVKNEEKPWCWPFGGGGAPKPELGARFLEIKFMIFAFL